MALIFANEKCEIELKDNIDHTLIIIISLFIQRVYRKLLGHHKAQSYNQRQHKTQSCTQGQHKTQSCTQGQHKTQSCTQGQHKKQPFNQGQN